MIRLSELPRRAAFLILSALLFASQHLLVWSLDAERFQVVASDSEFWVGPLQGALGDSALTPARAALIFAFGLMVASGLALLSFRQARRNRSGYALALFSVVPAAQLVAIVVLAILPTRQAEEEPQIFNGLKVAGVMHGLLAGIAIVVLAVLISAVTFGAYGWGLFVMSPFAVGIATGFLVNRRQDLGLKPTLGLSVGAAALGSLALVILSLEGVICILLAAPLAVPMVLAGGAIGRQFAIARLNRRNPLASVAVLPLVFMLEAAIPPETIISTAREVVVEAPPAAVWAALTSSEPIRPAPGLTAAAGLAYPVASHLAGKGVGALRAGRFSTGVATEVVTDWQPQRSLAFRILRQPPAMEEMSPYRRVHAPHVVGYFETGETRFALRPLPGGGTRLTVTALHRLRIEPVPYWAPIAGWAIRANVDRVLEDIRLKSLEADLQGRRLRSVG